jgi:ribosomal protein L11 methyltransferase
LASTPALDLRWQAGVDLPAFCELLHAALDDFAPLAIQDAEDGWRVFFRDRAARDRAVASLSTSYPTELAEIRPLDVADEDWARRSQAQLHAVRVGRLIVAPPWDVPPAIDDGAIVVVIDPSMGFGTGHHQTTRLCLSLLQEIELTGRRAIDVGTGSGVLAIATARLGAGGVIALDDDADALANAEANVLMNDVTAAVSLVHADLAEFRAAPAAVVTANLTGAVLRRHAGALRALVAGDGALIVSGFAVEEAAGVAAAFGATVEREVSEGEWAAVMLRFRSAGS